jgi:hypothetical protein
MMFYKVIEKFENIYYLLFSYNSSNLSIHSTMGNNLTAPINQGLSQEIMNAANNKWPHEDLNNAPLKPHCPPEDFNIIPVKLETPLIGYKKVKCKVTDPPTGRQFDTSWQECIAKVLIPKGSAITHDRSWKETIPPESGNYGMASSGSSTFYSRYYVDQAIPIDVQHISSYEKWQDRFTPCSDGKPIYIGEDQKSYELMKLSPEMTRIFETAKDASRHYFHFFSPDYRQDD